MRVLTKVEFSIKKEQYKKKILEGALYIHPTDTIYGIGCNAADCMAVRRVREAKERPQMPFSVIAPSKQWIMDNCEVNGKTKKWLDELPGPYTLVLKLKNKDAICDEVNHGMDTIGVRMPDHWFGETAKEMNVPLVTTSANIVGRNFMTKVENLDPKIKMKMDFMVYEGEKHGSPSKIVDLSGEEEKVTAR